MNKADQYDWVKPGDKGKQQRVGVNELKIDLERDGGYQRDEVSERSTLAIAREFSWVAFGSIVVMERASGCKYVVDGQQRLLAARKRGDIDSVPCALFKSDGREHEARAFISLNVRRKNVSALVKFNASARALISPEKDIADWLGTVGLFVTQDGRNSKGVDFPTSIIQTWNADCDATKKAIAIQVDVNGSEPLNSYAHKGFWWLIHSGVDISIYAKKLKRLGGLTAILRSIKTLAIETGAQASTRVCGIGVLRLINYKVRNKIKLSETA